MKKMTWDEYYEKCGGWLESTQISYMSRLDNFGPHDEVCDLACSFCDEKATSRMIRKALEYGVKFDADDLYEIHACVDTKLFNEALKTLTNYFNSEQLEEFVGNVDAEILEKLIVNSMNNHVTFTSEQVLSFIDEDISHNTLERMFTTSIGEWEEDEKEIVMEMLYPDLMEKKCQKEIDESVQSLTYTLNEISNQGEILTNQLQTYNESVKVKKKGFISSLFEFIGIYSIIKFLFGKEKNKIS